MYTKESLTEINSFFISEHGAIQDSDVNAVNELITAIEKTRTPEQPLPGDLVEYTTEYGDYSLAFIQSVQNGVASVCLSGGYPYTTQTDQQLSFSTAGGPWVAIPTNLEYVGKRKHQYWTDGHCGFCAYCAVDFFAEVNVWRYNEPNPHFGTYSTKDYRSILIHEKIKQKPNRKSFDEPDDFSTEEEYFAWLKTYKGVEFLLCEEERAKTIMVFAYTPVEYYISQEEWNAMDLPIDARLVNCSIVPIKYQYDDENHSLHEYRYTNSEVRDGKSRKPFEVALRQIKQNGFSRDIRQQTNQ